MCVSVCVCVCVGFCILTTAYDFRYYKNESTYRSKNQNNGVWGSIKFFRYSCSNRQESC